MALAMEIEKKLENVFRREQTQVLAEVITSSYNDLVKVSDFNELKEIVKEIGIKLGVLTDAQNRTEVKVGELAEAQKRTELELKRTEVRVGELAEAQKRTEIKVEELAEAQKRTELELQKLTIEHKKTREQVGGLSQTVGYTLENAAYKALPELLKKDYGITIQRRLKRDYIADNKGNFIEINIIGEARRNGKDIMIIGESKSQLSKKGVDNFIRKKLAKIDKRDKEIFPLVITHMISSPEVEEYVKDKGIALYYSYDF